MRFLPATGTVLALGEPSGAWTRFDGGIAAGSRVGVEYDPLLAKLSTCGATREAGADAHARPRSARRSVLGVVTNRDYLMDVVAHPAFAAGATHTEFLAEHFAAWTPPSRPPSRRRGRARGDRARAPRRPPWRRRRDGRVADAVGDARALAARSRHAMSLRKTIVVDGTPHAVEVDGRDDALTARVDDTALTLGLARDGTTVRVALADRTLSATVVRDRDVVWIAIDGEIHRCTAVDDARLGAAGGARSPEVIAPMPGKVLAVRVEAGQKVEAGDPLVVLEAMKMETIVSADGNAHVREVRVGAGAMVEPGQVLVVLEFD